MHSTLWRATDSSPNCPVGYGFCQGPTCRCQRRAIIHGVLWAEWVERKTRRRDGCDHIPCANLCISLSLDCLHLHVSKDIVWNTESPNSHTNKVWGVKQVCWLRGSMFSSYTIGGKPTEALGLENPPISPIRCGSDSPPSAVIKGEPAPLLLGSFVYLPLELRLPLLGPCTDVLCYVSFQTEYLCVWSAAVWLTRAHVCVHTHFHSTFPSVPEVPFALPPTSN